MKIVSFWMEWKKRVEKKGVIYEFKFSNFMLCNPNVNEQTNKTIEGFFDCSFRLFFSSTLKIDVKWDEG